MFKIVFGLVRVCKTVEDFTSTNLKDNPNAICVTVETDCAMHKVLTQNNNNNSRIIPLFGMVGVFSCVFPWIFEIYALFSHEIAFSSKIRIILLNAKQFLGKLYRSNYGSYLTIIRRRRS